MDSFDSDFFWVRSAIPAHNGRLVERLHKANEHLRELIDLVFSHQPAVTENYDDPDATKVSAAAYFYKECYLEPTLRLGTDGACITVQEFLERTAFHVTAAARNNVFYLLGDVGVGKTTLINAIISSEHNYLVKKGTWFVRVDLEKANAGYRYRPEELLWEIAQKTKRVLIRHPELHGEDRQVVAKMADLNALLTSLTVSEPLPAKRFDALATLYGDLVKTIWATKRLRLFLIIDNLDVMLHTNDRGMFYNHDSVPDGDVLHSVCELVRLFFHDVNYAGELDRMGANIVISMRDDSYQVLTRIGQTSLPEFDGAKIAAFTVEAPPWRQVLEARFKLLRYLASKASKPGLRDESLKLVETMVTYLQGARGGGRPLVERIRKLSNNSLRQLMTFFADAAVLMVSDWDASKKLFENQTVGLMTYILGGYRMFSQFGSGFPNIYLVNKQPKTRSPTAHLHPHSYWLKRLVLEFLIVRDQANEHTTAADVVDVFANKHYTSYPEHLVYECLGSLSEANGCKLARRALREVSQDVVVTEIRLLPRCQHFMTDVVDEFFYLQLIIDDYVLPLPRMRDSKKTNLLQDFGLHSTTSLDYCYFVEDSLQYWNNAKRMIQSKAYKVLLFLYILDAALQAERALYPKIFERLDHFGVRIPNVDNIRRSVLGHLASIRLAHKDLGDLQDNLAAAEQHEARISEFVQNAFTQADKNRRQAQSS